MQTRTRSRSSAIVSDRDGSSSRLSQHSPLPSLSSSSSLVSSMQRGANSNHYLYSNSNNIHGHGHLSTVPTSEAAVPYTTPQQSRPIASQPGTGTGAVSRLRSGSNPLYYRGLPMSSTNSGVAVGGDCSRENSTRIDLSTTTRNRSHSPLEPTSFRAHANESNGSRNRVSLEPTAPTLRSFGAVKAPGTGTRARAATSSEISGRGTPSISLSPSSPLVASPPQPRYATKPASSALYASSSSTTTAAKPNAGFGFGAASTNSAMVMQGSQNTSKSTSVGSEEAQGAQGSSPLPPTSAVDQAGRRLRELQLQDRFKAAQSFIERTVGQSLPSNDLHESLKDGVILCRLANRLRPGTVEQISLKNLPFVKMENISNFLNAAKQLGVQSSDLFQTVDLYEGKDMTQVVSTILTLERVLGGVARMVAKDKRPGPSPIVSAGSTPTQIAKVGALGPAVVTRMRSKTAHTPSTASTTASIRPSSSAYYAAQVRKLEEDSIRFAHGYDFLEANAPKLRDHRYQSTPMISRALSPSAKGRVSHQLSLSDIQAGVDGANFGSDDTPAIELEEENRREQRALVFGRDSPAPMEQSTTIAKSASGSTLATDGRLSSLDIMRRKKKSISLDPQAANAVMGNPSYRDGLGSPGSPGLLTQSASYSAISHLHSPGLTSNVGQMTSLKQHTRFSSERTLVDGTARAALGSPSSSRSTTPVQGLRKSTNSVEPLREKLELLENDALVATFQLGNCIGRGQFGSVYKALNLGNGQMVAVKRIKIDGLKENQMDMLMQEVDLLKSLAHPSIVKYEGFIMTYGYLNIILEFVENGSLLTTLKSFGTFPEKLVVAYVVKILEGLVYLHGKQVVHCDLKAANILTTKNGNVKLSDFGVSLNLKVKESDFGAVAGTPNWMAPEVIELKGASPASDIWSLGCTIVEMLTGRPPYADLLAMTTLFRIVEDERPPLPSNLSVDLLDFLCQCFQKDPTRRPSAGTLGRHVWIKRNFASKELKPMDSLPYMKRKSMEPKEKVLLAATLESSAAKRSSTPLGLSSGVPPPSPSAAPIHGDGRGTRRRSVDSVSGFYASSTVPAPTHASERQQDQIKGGKTTSHHQFVKSSFAKPVECRLCHDYVKKQAVICQDCSMVFHRKCQFYVGDTCFPAPHLSYFQTPTPAQSVPNLKMMMNGKPKGNSRPSSRTSLLNLEDRSRSVTPSHGAPGRPCPTPPLTLFPKRESTTIDERVEQRLSVKTPTAPLYLAQRSTSPDIQIGEGQSRVPRPSSRQSDSPTSPTALSNLRNLITGPKRFSFGTKKNTSTTASHPLPTPPTSYTPTAPAMSSLHARHHSATPDSGKVLFQQRSPAPATPPKSLPVPITGVRGGAGGSSYRDQEHVPGIFDTDDSIEEHDGRFSYDRTSGRPSSISLLSSSAPPVHGEYQSRMMGRTSVASTASCPEEDDEEEEDEYRARGMGGRKHEDVRDMSEHDLEALLIPSANRSPRLSLEFGGHYRTRSRSISQTLSQSIEQPQDLLASGSRLSSSISFGAVSNGRPPSQQQQYLYSGRPQLNNGYQSSGSSSAAMTSSYSSHSNKSSSASSVGSVAALLEEEERMMKEMKQNQGRSGTPVGTKGGMLGVPSAFQQLGTQPPQAHHVGIKTMLSRFSASSKDTNNHVSDSNNNNITIGGRLTVQDKDKQKTNKSAVAYAAAARHQIQAPGHYTQPHSQPPSGMGVRAVHPIPYQSNGEGAASKTNGAEFSQGYEAHEYHSSYRTGYKNGLSDQGARSSASSGWPPPSSQDFQGARQLQQLQQQPQQQQYDAVGDVLEGSRKKAVTLPISLPGSTAVSSSQSVPISAAAAAASALRRGGKVIRRSMGATVEKDRWD